MPAEFWVAVAAQLLSVLGAVIHLERRITRIETNVQWLMRRQPRDQERTDEPHPHS